MANPVTITCDPKQTWQLKALAAVEQAFGQSLDLWTYQSDTDWSRSYLTTEPSETDMLSLVSEDVDSELLALIKNAVAQEKPLVQERSFNQYLLAIPLDEQTAATTAVQTDSPELFLRLAEVAGRYFHQQEELVRVREENDFFLKQVSDDFEELTFLRSMAERLGLEDSTHTIEKLVQASLPELGKSAHAEEMYFVSDLGNDQLEILVAWQKEGFELNRNNEATIFQLVEEHRSAAVYQPIIKNGRNVASLRTDIPEVRDFIMVAVGSDEEPIGWFLAINREAESEEVGESDLPEWRLNQHEFGTSEATLLSTAAAMTASHANNLSLFQERESLLVNVVRTLVSAVEAKDQYTCGHSERVALYGKRLAQQVGYDEESCELLYLTGLLHDIGKIAVSDAILNKPDQLTDEEFAEIQRHPEEGWKILQGLEQLNYVLPGVLHHHERCDGKGYPDRLLGKQIPQDGRILAVADAFDAMTSDRAYRTGMPHEKAVAILRDGAGTQWDAEVVEAFLEIVPEIITIRKDYLPRHHPSRTPTQSSPQ